MRGPLLFFDRYMETRPYLWRKRIYPYNALEVRLEISEHESKGIRSIIIIPPSSGRMDRIGINEQYYSTEEEFTRLEHFLEERIPNFHREEAADGLSDENRKKRNMRWAYALIVLSTLWSAFMAWYLLPHR